MMKRLRIGLILAALIPAAAGCASSSKPVDHAAALKAERVSISVWALSDSWEWLEPAVQDFERLHPAIQVEVTQREVDPLKESLKIAASSKTLPDMWFTWGGTLGSFYADNGLTMDLTQVAKEHNWSDLYNKAARDMSTYNGKNAGIPVHLNVVGMWYSKAIFEQAGLNPPSTFAEFESQLHELKDKRITPLAFGNKGGWHTMRLTEQLLEQFAGSKLHDQLNAMEASWNNPAVVQAFAKLREYTDKGYFPEGYSVLDPSEAKNQFFQGKAGMINEGTWFAGTMSGQGIDNKNFDIFPFPSDQSPRRASVFTEMFQINAESDPAKQEAAIQLGEYLTSAEVINKYGDNYGTPAALHTTVLDKKPHLKSLLEMASAGGFLITDQALPQIVVQQLFEAQDKVVLKEWTPEQAAATMEQAVLVYKSANPH